jgi:hypothetical protein
MTETKPKRRWFTFSLRMAFVVLTVVSLPMGWLGYQLNLIRQRDGFLKNLRANSREKHTFWTVSEMGSKWEPKPQIPPVRRILGDQPYSRLILPAHFGADLIDKANDLFPEAQVWRWTQDSQVSGTGRFLMDATRSR